MCSSRSGTGVDGATACDHMRAEPLDRRREGGLGRAPERREHVRLAHLRQPPQEVARVVEHQPGVQPPRDEPADEIGGAPVAVQEHRRVVIVALPRALEHPLQVRDQRRGRRVAVAEDRRLVHVQRDAKRGADPRRVDARVQGEGCRSTWAESPVMVGSFWSVIMPRPF